MKIKLTIAIMLLSLIGAAQTVTISGQTLYTKAGVDAAIKTAIAAQAKVQATTDLKQDKAIAVTYDTLRQVRDSSNKFFASALRPGAGLIKRGGYLNVDSSRTDSLVKVVNSEKSRTIEVKRLMDLADIALAKRIDGLPVIDLSMITNQIATLSQNLEKLSGDQNITVDNLYELTKVVSDLMEKYLKVKAAYE